MTSSYRRIQSGIILIFEISNLLDFNLWISYVTAGVCWQNKAMGYEQIFKKYWLDKEQMINFLWCSRFGVTLTFTLPKTNRLPCCVPL